MFLYNIHITTRNHIYMYFQDEQGLTNCTFIIQDHITLDKHNTCL